MSSSAQARSRSRRAAPERSFDSPLDAVRRAVDALHAARHALDAEIRVYPTPISGCDAQFNHLLAERRRVTQALAALAADVHIPTPRALEPVA